eukprot:TRINITY_DN35375_c0_g1_i1.p5 TRINITY_DN35375_c0_g1~~TRINITY_DN35375_c0_g1_i1.p5  ORF type:complete len:197 (+),score=-1.31 TRINITY_DN35375_c0_g1_i1:843-1433(+)
MTLGYGVIGKRICCCCWQYIMHTFLLSAYSELVIVGRWCQIQQQKTATLGMHAQTLLVVQDAGIHVNQLVTSSGYAVVNQCNTNTPKRILQKGKNCYFDQKYNNLKKNCIFEGVRSQSTAYLYVCISYVYVILQMLFSQEGIEVGWEWALRVIGQELNQFLGVFGIELSLVFKGLQSRFESLISAQVIYVSIEESK